MRTSSRAAMASSSAAAWSVNASSSRTFRSAIRGNRGRIASRVSAATTGKRNQAGHHVTPAITHIGTAVASVPITRQTMRRHSEPIS